MSAEVTTEQSLDRVSIRAKNVKCFGNDPAGFDALKPINIAIGRNNSGKSTLLDLVQAAVSPKSIQLRGHMGRDPIIDVGLAFTPDLKTMIPSRTATVDMGNGNSRDLNLEKWSRDRLKEVQQVICQLDAKGDIRPLGFDRYSPTEKDDIVILNRIIQILRPKLGNPFGGYQFRRLAAERDVLPEQRNGSVGIGPSGIGFTNVIRNLLTAHNQDRGLVENMFLDALNSILQPDCEFSRILILENVAEHNNAGPWEIYLEEETKGRSIPLSQMGSGLKTVMLVLGNILIMPRMEEKPIAAYIFAFEELENNLHPAAQRRLFRYLRQTAKGESCHFFITTHSNVVIDLFAHDDEAQILHVTHNGFESKVNRYTSSTHGWNILDDLDVRASDILQSNAVIWVEGPSDRIYVNRWIDLWTNGELQEGVHYQCLFFGGAIGAHFSFDDPDEVNELIAALKINRRAIIVTDCDRKEEGDELKVHTKRLIDEVNAIEGYGFATKGRTIEHYIPVEVWKELSGDATLEPPEFYADAMEYAHEKLGVKDTKVKLAKKVTELLDREMLVNTLDLAIRLQEMCAKIYDWNRLPVLTSVTETISSGVSSPTIEV